MRKNATIAIMAVIILGLIGWVFFLFNENKKQTNIGIAEIIAQKKYPLLSKLIFTVNPNDIIVNFIPLRTALNDYVSQQDNKVGVYFEYLPSGTSISANGATEVKLASLSKVPLAMSIFKKIERGNLSLTDTLTVKKENLDQKFGNLWEKWEGAQLSVVELVRLALAESDNTAYNIRFSQS